jgi:hypothetical protein
MEIVEESNRYTTTLDEEGRLSKRPNWKDIMKKISNFKCYRMKNPSIFHCSIINNITLIKRYPAY